MRGGGTTIVYERLLRAPAGTGKCDLCTLGTDVVGSLEGVQEWEVHGLHGVRQRRLMLCSRCSGWARRQQWRAPLEFDVPMPTREATLG